VVKPNVVGTITNTAVVGPNDDTPGDNTSTTTNTVIGPDLKILKVGTPSQVVLGNNLTYNLTVTNIGTAPSTTGTVSDNLPTTVDLVTNDPGCTAAGRALTCNVGALAVGASRTFTIIVKPNTVGTITNTATVGPPCSDPDNCTSTTTNTVVSPDLKIVKTGPATANVGDNITYTLTVTNTGDGIANSVVVTDSVQNGSTFVSATAGCTIATGIVTCTSSNLAPGGTLAFSVTVKANAAGTITNTAVVSPTDNTPEDNTSTVNTLVSQVLPETIVAPQELPRTGTDSGRTVDLALVLVGAGLVLVGIGALGRRRLDGDEA